MKRAEARSEKTEGDPPAILLIHSESLGESAGEGGRESATLQERVGNSLVRSGRAEYPARPR